MVRVNHRFNKAGEFSMKFLFDSWKIYTDFPLQSYVEKNLLLWFFMFLRLKKYLNLKRALGDQLKERSLLRSMPLRVHLEVNDRCNLNCIMCARRSENIPKDTGDLDPAIVHRISPWLSFANYVGLAGNGEPFLHPKLFEILDIIRGAGSVPSIVTNGTLLSDECLGRLIQLGPSILDVSFDGATKQTFETIRVGADFNAIVGNLKHLAALKSKHRSPYPILNFLVCVMQENKGELVEVVNLAKTLGVSKVDFQTIYPFTQDARKSVIQELKEVHEVTAPAMNRTRELGIMATLSPIGFGIKERLRFEHHELKPGTRLFCENVWQTLHVGVDGDVRFCCFWTGRHLGNLAEQTIPELWNHPDFQSLRTRLAKGEIPDDCRNCHLLDIHNPQAIRSKFKVEIDDLKHA